MSSENPSRRFGPFRRLASSLIAAMVMVAGCTSESASNPAPSPGSSASTLRVVLTGDGTREWLDPQSAYTAAQWELLRCCLLRTLMTYPGVPDIAGTQPIPDLASSMPSVSSDGMIWTFHLRHAVHYAPPLQDVEVTAGDIVRALLRAGSPDANRGRGPGLSSLPLIEGFSEYVSGKADAISGVSAPDDYTLRVQETHQDTSIVDVFAMPFTAPIPPLPDDPTARFGAATGHPFVFNYKRPPTAGGYGRYLVTTGPYMFEGSEDLDLTLPPDQQAPISGFTPGGTYGSDGFTVGRMTLVRDPSWDAATDRNRLALADRIEISIVPSNEQSYDRLEAGSIDVIMGEEPVSVEESLSKPSLRDRIVRTTSNASYVAWVNVAQPPFDDAHVRRALALALDRAALAEEISGDAGFEGSVTSHLVPDSMEGALLAAWDPFASSNDAGDETAAQKEMDLSRYHGACSGHVCHDVVAAVYQGGERSIATLRAGLAPLGITATFRGDVDCYDPTTHVALCVGQGWGTDHPVPGVMFWPELSSGLGEINPSLLGSTPEQLRRWGYALRHVPSIDADYERCSEELGARARMCWARLDQLLVGHLVAIIPYLSRDTFRLKGQSVVAYSLDQAFGEPSLDRVAVASGAPAPS